jgi:hypothetical protein
MGAQHFTGAGDLEPLGDGFSRFAARDRLRHKARKIATISALTNAFAG